MVIIMRKILSLCLVVVLSFSLTGCISRYFFKQRPDNSTQPDDYVSSEVSNFADTSQKTESVEETPVKPVVPVIETVTVPDVYNFTATTAQNELYSAGLTPTIVYENSNNVPANYVIRTYPARSVTVKKGSAVTIYVSKGLAGLNTTISHSYDGMLAAKLKLSPDFTFEMTANLYEGYGTITGTYTINADKTLTCVVKDKDFWGFIGDDLSGFKLTPQGNGSYVIKFDNVEYVGALPDNSVLTK